MVPNLAHQRVTQTVVRQSYNAACQPLKFVLHIHLLVSAYQAPFTFLSKCYRSLSRHPKLLRIRQCYSHGAASATALVDEEGMVSVKSSLAWHRGTQVDSIF